MTLPRPWQIGHFHRLGWNDGGVSGCGGRQTCGTPSETEWHFGHMPPVVCSVTCMPRSLVAGSAPTRTANADTGSRGHGGRGGGPLRGCTGREARFACRSRCQAWVVTSIHARQVTLRRLTKAFSAAFPHSVFLDALGARRRR